MAENKNSVSRILVLGCAGSGKSYLAKKLSKIFNLPVYHLDLLYWRPHWTTAPEDEFKQGVVEIVNKEKWIIDGNYSGTLEARLKRANRVYFLDLPTEICLENVKKRYGKPRDDFPDYLEEKEDPAFLEFIKNFKNRGRLIILSMLEKYPEVEVTTFTNRVEMDEYLSKFETE